MARCQATTKAGRPCRAPASAGGLCFLHANPAQARELGRIGGRKNRQQTQTPRPASSMTIAEVNEVLVEAVDGVRSNKLSARRALALVQLCTALMKTLPAADLEARLTRLEEQVAEQAVTDASDVTARPTPQNGSTARDGAGPWKASDKLRTAAEDSLAEGPPAASDVELEGGRQKGEEDVESPKPIGKPG